MVENIRVRMLTDDGSRDLDLAFPSDEQWIKRQAARKIIIRQLGRGASETDIRGAGEADAALLRDLTGGNGFNEAEASMVVSMLSEASVEGCDRDDDGFRVTLRACGGRVFEFVLRRPTAKQVMQYRTPGSGFVRVIDLPYGQQEIRTNLKAAATLFDDLLVGKFTRDQDESVPYDGPVSIIHKAPAIAAVITELDRMLEPSAEDFQPGNRPRATSGGL